MRDGMIIEIPFSEKAYQYSVSQLTSKDLIIVIPNGHTLAVTLNSVDISKILPTDAYESYIKSVNIKKYVLNGTWYDSKENKIIRHEDWKQRKLDSQKKIESGQDEVMTSEKWKSLRAKIDSVGEQLRVSGIIK